MNKIFIESYLIKEIEDIVISRCRKEFDNKKVCFVTIAHSGLPALYRIADELDFPVYVLNSPEEVSFYKDKFKEYDHVIVFDDIYDTGKTYQKYDALLKPLSISYSWIFLTAKQSVPEGTFCPFILNTSAYVLFPWEVISQ